MLGLIIISKEKSRILSWRVWKEWNYVGANRVATYTNLTPGDYKFKVKVSNADGSWSKTPLELKNKNITFVESI
jgi:hypothetical protein